MLFPARQRLRDRIHQGDAPFDVGRENGIADAPERRVELGHAGAQLRLRGMSLQEIEPNQSPDEGEEGEEQDPSERKREDSGAGCLGRARGSRSKQLTFLELYL